MRRGDATRFLNISCLLSVDDKKLRKNKEFNAVFEHHIIKCATAIGCIFARVDRIKCVVARLEIRLQDRIARHC